jgi:hypothetical protein
MSGISALLDILSNALPYLPTPLLRWWYKEDWLRQRLAITPRSTGKCLDLWLNENSTDASKADLFLTLTNHTPFRVRLWNLTAEIRVGNATLGQLQTPRVVLPPHETVPLRLTGLFGFDFRAFLEKLAESERRVHGAEVSLHFAVDVGFREFEMQVGRHTSHDFGLPNCDLDLKKEILG